MSDTRDARKTNSARNLKTLEGKVVLSIEYNPGYNWMKFLFTDGTELEVGFPEEMPADVTINGKNVEEEC